MRTTKGNVESAFKYLAEAAGKRVAVSYNDVGAWRLDYLAPHGYNIEEINNAQGGVSHPFTTSRMKAEAFYDACWMAIRALDMIKREVSQ